MSMYENDFQPSLSAAGGDPLSSAALFGAMRELEITHGGETYRLRLTSQNKLILTK